MGLAAIVKHRCPGRLRLKLDSSCEQQDLIRLVDHFRETGQAQSVEGNLLTKTLLIKAKNDAELQSILDKAGREGLFDLKDAPSSGVALSLLDIRNALDRFFREVSDNRLDFRSGMALVMTGLGIRQLFVGKFMPAGLTLVFYAIGLLEIDKIQSKR